MVLRHLILPLLVVISLAHAAPVQACSCLALDDAQALALHDVAFVGRVRSVQLRPGHEEDVTFEVLEPLKGVSSASYVIRRASLHLCPVPVFQVGRRYRVFATHVRGVTEVGACNPSRELAD